MKVRGRYKGFWFRGGSALDRRWHRGLLIVRILRDLTLGVAKSALTLQQFNEKIQERIFRSERKDAR